MNNNIARHSLSLSIILHLLPGILTGACYYLLVPVVTRYGYPTVMALILAGTTVFIPYIVIFLTIVQRRSGGKLSGGVIHYVQKAPLWQYLVFVPVILVSAGLIMTVLNFTSEYLKSLFSWIPPNLMLDMGLDDRFEHSRLLLTYSLFLLLIVVIMPVAEEFYFRGYLLPRMPPGLKRWTEPVHTALFAIYHTWTPWMFLSRTLGVLPLVYVVRWKKNIWMGIIAHCLLNSIDLFIAMAFIFRN
jgi:uncharacterized protein